MKQVPKNIIVHVKGDCNTVNMYTEPKKESLFERIVNQILAKIFKK